MTNRLPYLVMLLLVLTCMRAMAQDEGELFDEGTIEEYNSNQQKFFEKPAASDFEKKQIPEAKVREIKSRDAYWYADLAPEQKTTEKKSAGLWEKDWFRTLFWIVFVGGFITILGWFLFSSNILVFRKRPAKLSGTSEEELANEDIFSINYSREIQKAVAAGNYRLAVRLHYLQALMNLSELNLIKYSPEKTNSDYLYQLSSSRHYKNFFRLTRLFDYVWYGRNNLSEESYQQARKDFSTFKQQLS